MTVLQYSDAFESYLTHIDDYDEVQYLVHYIFGLRPEIMRLVYMQQPASLLAAKIIAEKTRIDASGYFRAVFEYKKTKDVQGPA